MEPNDTNTDATIASTSIEYSPALNWARFLQCLSDVLPRVPNLQSLIVIIKPVREPSALTKLPLTRLNSAYYEKIGASY